VTPAESGIARASLILVVGFLGSRALGVLRNMVLAATFGTGPELDAYFAAFRLPDALFQLIAGAALGSAFIPTFASVFARVSQEAAWRLASVTLNLLSLVGVMAAGVGFLLAPWIVPWTVFGHPPEQQDLTVHLARVMMLSTAFFCASGMITGVLHARFHFFLPAVAPWLYNLSIIGGALFLSSSMGMVGPAIGVAAGSALHLAVQLPGLARVGMRYRLVFNVHTSGVAEVLRLMGPRVVTLGAAQISWFVTVALASTLHSGSIAALTYAWAVVMMPLGILGMAPAMAAFPSLAEAAAREDWGRYRALLSSGIRLALFLSIPGGLGLILVQEPLVTLLFERGQFGEESTALTVVALTFYAVGLFAHVLLEVASRGSYALQDTRTPLIFALGGMCAHAAFSLLLLRLGGVAGLALAMSLSTTLEAVGLLLAVAQRAGRFDWGGLALSVGKTTFATVAMALPVAWLVLGVTQASETPGLVVVLLGSGSLGAAVFFGVSRLLRSADLAEFLALVWAKGPP